MIIYCFLTAIYMSEQLINFVRLCMEVLAIGLVYTQYLTSILDHHYATVHIDCACYCSEYFGITVFPHAGPLCIGIIQNNKHKTVICKLS